MLIFSRFVRQSFNTQPPEGGWPKLVGRDNLYKRVSTHSRLKAAGRHVPTETHSAPVSTHSRLKAAGHGADDAHERL